MNTRIMRIAVTAAAVLGVGTLAGCLEEKTTLTQSEAETTSDSNESNAKPTISGNPDKAITIGESYSFTPKASDADGDTLSFSISSLPSWASFDGSTGKLTGQPTLADVGLYRDIEITVSDGTSNAKLSAFSIDVTQAELGSMTVSWAPPQENSDGSSLTDLAGYWIYYGTSKGSYPNRVEIDTAGISSYVVDNLVPDTYYVVATSYNRAGIESSYSNEVTKVVQ